MGNNVNRFRSRRLNRYTRKQKAGKLQAFLGKIVVQGGKPKKRGRKR